MLESELMERCSWDEFRRQVALDELEIEEQNAAAKRQDFIQRSRQFARKGSGRK